MTDLEIRKKLLVARGEVHRRSLRLDWEQLREPHPESRLKSIAVRSLGKVAVRLLVAWIRRGRSKSADQSDRKKQRIAKAARGSDAKQTSNGKGGDDERDRRAERTKQRG